MATATGSLGHPEWTTKAEKRGLDPLGMQTTSVSLYQQLVPGISNVTLRMRYYGLYAWLAQRYARDVGDTSVERWCLYLRRAEALYALVAVHAGGERGVAGVDWATRTLAASGDEVVFHPGCDRSEGEPQYLKQKFGVFAAAYGSQLVDIGVLEYVPGHTIPVPTRGTGEKLADAFAAAVGAVGDAFLETAVAGTASKARLVELALMLPSRVDAGSSERDLYERLLFVGHSKQDQRAMSRRLSLRLVLMTAKNLGRAVSMDDLRWNLYASHGSPHAGLSSDALMEKQRFAWVVYQANDLLHVCYETILKLALDILGGTPAGMPAERLARETVARMMSAVEDFGATSWQQLLSTLPLATNPLSDEDTTSELALQRTAIRGSRPEVIVGEQCIRSALLLLATLHRRFGNELERIATELPLLAASEFTRSIVTELRLLELHSHEPLVTFLSRIVSQRVLDRHLWVAIQKFRGQGDYTFLLESDDGRVRLRQKDGPVLTNPRLSSAVAFLEDIHLLNEDGPTQAALRLIESA
jgi:hypothetical protein